MKHLLLVFFAVLVDWGNYPVRFEFAEGDTMKDCQVISDAKAAANNLQTVKCVWISERRLNIIKDGRVGWGESGGRVVYICNPRCRGIE